MAISSTSSNKEGAWAFIYYMLSEEAGAYFSGDKELDQVVKIIENRVQLYLDEHY